MNSALSRFAKITLFAGILFLSLGPNLRARGQPDRGGGRQAAPTEAPREEASPETPAASPEDAGAEAPPEMTEEELAAAAALAAIAERNAEILELDIKTSTLSELAAWCRSLGLSEGGDRTALGNRLRSYFKLAEVYAAEGAATVPIEGAPIPKVITIESARSTEYFTIDAVDEDYARLRGDVRVTLKDGDSIHRITAWEILYNRTRNLMSATGGVEYVKESEDSIETFRGESITVDLDNWSSIFMGGVSERSLKAAEGEAAKEEEGTTYRFAGTVISRSDEEATVLTHAEISNGSNPEALWSLAASKIWLLPGADFALLNGVLKVGEIPVLYIPVFFFPGDEIIFHPVLGYRSREGSFLQTTTYILGRPKAKSSTERSSLSSILGNSPDMEKVRHGIFLRSTGKKSRDPNDIRLSVLLDAYTNLGAYVGTELALPEKGVFKEYNLSLGAGFTRDIMQIPENNTFYTPFATFDGTSNWNWSRLFTADVPFRFRMTNAGALGGTYGSFSWSLPFYSDPYVDRDFLDRSEEMDYIKMLKQGGNTPEEEEDALTKNTIGSYEWRLSGSSSLSPSILSPYISNFSISNITSFVTFNYRTSTAFSKYATELRDELNYYYPADKKQTELNIISPRREFFYPEKFTIYSISTSITGTPLTIGGSRSPKAKTPGSETDPGDEDPFKGLGVPNSPWEVARDEDANSGMEERLRLTPPGLSHRFDLPLTGPRFSIDYQLTPTSATELQFPSSPKNWPESEDIDWKTASSILTNIRTDGSTTFTLADMNSFITEAFTFSASTEWQGYGYINEEAEEYRSRRERNEAQIRAREQTSFTTSWETTTTLKPFYRSFVWSNTNFQYNIKGLIAKSKFERNTNPDGTPLSYPDPDKTYWDILYGKWDKKNLDSHRAQANLQALVLNKNQNLSIAVDIPPEDSAFIGDATMRVWKSETTFNTKIRGRTIVDKKTRADKERSVAIAAGKDPGPYKEYKYDQEEEDNKTYDFQALFDDPFYEPLRFTETLRFTDSLSLSQSVVYDPEEEEFQSTTSSLSAYGFTASFTATYSTTDSLEDTDPTADGEKWEWKTSPGSSFSPREFKLGYNHTFKKAELWKKRLSFSIGLNTALAFDLQRFTNSNFSFGMNFTLGITKFLDISLGASSANGSIYRYFLDTALFDIPEGLPVIGETNLFTDLLNSFRFDDDNLRRQSGFKLKTFNLSLLHHLGDWNAKLDMTLAPYLPTDSREYKFNTELSFIVQWIPISEIKSEITYNKEKFVYK
ncbi:hypothetical protein AGMMS49942_09470 [Spirochaetia bacterium]|nr:hypothetical protein AGMMS49942_09470 [Spirochaetia bacterium]